MPTPDPNSPDPDSDSALIAAACALLRQFTYTSADPVTADPALVRQAVRVVADHSDYQILGICAETMAAAETALQRYGQALGYEPSGAIAPTITGPTYIKFNPKTGRCHADPYIGTHRGVLLSCQSAYDQDVNETFGHLPMDLFDP